METKILTDFEKKIALDGENRISYHYERGDLVLIIFYGKNDTQITLHFESCSYLFSAPWLGFSPFERMGSQLTINAIPHSGCLYEHFGTDLLLGSEISLKKSGTNLARRHFWIYFETTGVTLDIIAKGVKDNNQTNI